MENTTFSGLSQFGFTPVNNNVCVGTWNNYAVELQRYGGRMYYVYLAIRLAKDSGSLGKALKAELKGAGIKGAGVNRVTKNYLHCSFTFGKGEAEIPSFRAFMDTLTGALQRNGIGPANTCAVTGAANPDSLCLMVDNKYAGYQPVCGGAVRQKEYEVQSKVEDNENNGSYVAGFFGAVIGMLVAVALNVFLMVLTNRMYVVLFALVPICAMFGYRLFKGRTNKTSIIIMILLSLLAIPMIVYFIAVVTLMREYALPLAEALSVGAQVVTDSAYLSEIKSDLVMMLLFMVLGLLFAWRFLRAQLNSTKTQIAQIQLDTMRPNPLAVPAAAPSGGTTTPGSGSFPEDV